MAHADDTRGLWSDIAWIETVAQRWVEFFESLLDEPFKAQALCALGVEFVKGNVSGVPNSVSNVWVAFFSSLYGSPGKTALLCELGLQLVRNEPHDCELARRMARKLLQTRLAVPVDDLPAEH